MKTDNELIAEFMGGVFGRPHEDDAEGWRFKPQPTSYYRDNAVHVKLNYDSDWNWLMPVVEKIEKLYRDAFPSNEEFVRRILAKENPLDGPYMDVVGLPLSTPISEVHKAVVNFIKWYNQPKKP